jgi:hypothetical protein
LLSRQEFDKAAQLCLKILGKNKDSWEEEVYKFAQIKQLKVSWTDLFMEFYFLKKLVEY